MNKNRFFFAISFAALISNSAFAATSIVQDHVLINAGYTNFDAKPASYETSYSLKLGQGFGLPYITVHFDNATGKASYAKMLATESYLSYLHDVTVFTINPGDEISQNTLSNTSYKSIFTTSGWSRPADWGNRAISSTGWVEDIYLGFSVKISDLWSSNANNPQTQHFGWIHLKYTQANGLLMAGSAMTLDGSGIYSNSLTTISSVDETGSSLLACAGLLGLLACKTRRRSDVGYSRNLT